MGHAANVSFSKELSTEITDCGPDNAHRLIEDVCHEHPVAGEPRIDELYRSDRLDLHVYFHFVCGSANGTKSDDFCALLHGLPLGVRDDHVPIPIICGEPKLRNCKLIACNEQQAVLIDYVELVKNPNIGLVRNGVSLVRLTPLDFCKRGTSDKWLEGTPYFGVKASRPVIGETNREYGLLGSTSGCAIKDRKLVNQVIEGGSQIVDAITNHQRQRWIDWINFSKLADQVLPFTVNIEGNALSLRFRAQSQFQSRVGCIEVCLRPPDLGAKLKLARGRSCPEIIAP
jgi:hypothetical protein